jgi:cytochrome c553
MKKVALIILCILVAVGIAAAQTYSEGTGLTGKDVLGAHNNGGRGCAGCHAPHSGGRGGGGNAATNAAAFNDPYSGNDALFGQDLTPVYGMTLQMGDGGRFVETIPAFSVGDEEIRGIAMCLACHDGNIAKGAMMQNASWEQQYNLLPPGVYGGRAIPTLLGNDGSAAGNYNNDHPVGVQATLGAARVVTNNATTTPLTITFANNAISNIVATPGTGYANFAANYGYPAIAGSPWSWGVANPAGNTNPLNVFLLCTTCHNQHVMYIYQPPRGKLTDSYIGGTGKNYPTYFFVNGPYNPGAGNADPTKAASTTQFCRQCHYGEANENFGVNNVKTQF